MCNIKAVLKLFSLLLLLAQRYDVRQKEWHNMPNMLTRRSKHGSVEVDGHIYVVGGYDGQVTLNTLESYSFQAGR